MKLSAKRWVCVLCTVLLSSCADLEKEIVYIVVDAAAPPDAGWSGATDAPLGVQTDAELSPRDDAGPSLPTSFVPYFEKWKGSVHANASAEAFSHWNTDGKVPTTCAKCHSSEGFSDFIGADGTAVGTVEKDAPVQSVIRCETCHSEGAAKLSTVTLPSGVVVDGLGPEARCMTCHQGRASGATVDEGIKAAMVASPDEVSDKLRFTNIHYYPAAATLYAGVAKGGYQYADRVYDTRFRHVEGFNTCTGCHDPHSTKPRFDACATCHQGVSDVEGAQKIRMISSFSRDYDGDGNRSEGIYFELSGLMDKLLAVMVRYGAERAAPLCYNGDSYPYWFSDTNNNGQCDPDERSSANGFKKWTARLVRAAYNYQMVRKDPGAFAHNAKYIMQLLYDSAQDVNAGLTTKADLSSTVRGDVGHFDGTSLASRNWDANDEVVSTCSRCHGGEEGYRFFLQYGVGKTVQETANGLECGTCHTSFGNQFKVLDVATTALPGGVIAKQMGYDNLCSTCHAGRTGKADIDAAIASGSYKFLNVHYLAAGGTKLGSSGKMGYEYAGNTYAGSLVHAGGVQCTSCHDPVASNHTFAIDDAWDMRCKGCHADAGGDASKIRITHTLDYDGDNNTSESLAAEIEGMGTKVLTALIGSAGSLCYAEATYPYFFKDIDGVKQPLCSSTDAQMANRFTAWTPALMKAAHNFQISLKEPGAWAHNFDYMAQLLYDSAVDLSGAGQGMRRP